MAPIVPKISDLLFRFLFFAMSKPKTALHFLAHRSGYRQLRTNFRELG
jgi:hypothetical protein